MVAQIFHRGINGRGAVEYLIDQNKHDNKVTILGGNPDLTKRLIETNDNKWKYTSGVLSFEEADLSAAAKAELMDDFEKSFFPGLEKDQFNILWVQHQDKGRLELHFVAPRLELRSDTALSIYSHKRDFKKKDLFQTYWNAKLGLTSPQDIEKKNTLSTMPRRWASVREATAEAIHEAVEREVGNGTLRNRDDVIFYLEANGYEISRKTKNFVSVQSADTDGKSIRLKGLWYGESFTNQAEAIRSVEAVSSGINIGDERIDRADFKRVREELDRTIDNHAQYNRERYKDNRPILRQDKEPDIIPVSRIHSEADQKRGIDLPNLDSRIHAQNNQGVRNDRIRTATHRVIRAGEARQRAREERATRYAHINRRSAEQDHRPIESGVKRIIARRNARKGIQSIQQNIDRIARSVADTIARSLSQTIDGVIKMAQDKEIDKFKTEINIAEFAQSIGYTIDKEKSSRVAPVLEHSNGDKIVVGQNKENGHFIYFSAKDDADNGTIIDFIQNRMKANFGQVRKIARDWLKNGSKNAQIIKTTISPTSHDKLKIQRLWHFLKTDQFFFDWRGIDKDLLNDVIKSGRAKYNSKDDHLFFSMLDTKGLVGLDRRNTKTGEKHIIAESERGVWTYKQPQSAKRIVVFESPIDALSYRQMNWNNGEDAYLSTQGTFGQTQEDAIKALCKANPHAKWVMATDKDEKGNQIADKITSLIQSVSSAQVLRETPIRKDWNEDLNHSLSNAQERSRSLSLSR